MEPTKNISNPPGSMEPGLSAESVTSDVKELASEAVDRAKGLASEQVSKQREKSAGQIVKLAGALHHTSEELGDAAVAPYVDRAADALDRLSDSVRGGDARDAVRAAERFARNEPLLFLGGAFVFGMLAARFLKSSERRREEDELSEESGGEIGRP